jgi:hypothetical protein
MARSMGWHAMANSKLANLEDFGWDEYLDWETEKQWLDTIAMKYWALQYCLFKED